MKDTCPEIYKVQREIMLKMTPMERIKQGYDMIDFAYNVVNNRIKREKQAQYNIGAIFKELYKNDFNDDELKTISEYLNNVQLNTENT